MNGTGSASPASGTGASDIEACAYRLSARELLLVDAVAERVAGLLHAVPARSGLVDAATLADALGISRDCVYAHANQLGGCRVGDGPRGRWRFDLSHALAAWASRRVTKPDELNIPVPSASRRRKPAKVNGRPLLPIRE